MKQLKLATSFFVSASLLTSLSFAHTLDKDAAISVMPYNWTGFYAGLNVGAVKHTMNVTDNQAVTFNATIEQVADPAFTGGFQAGYRRQLDQGKAASGVFGLELSADFLSARFEKEYGSPFALYQLHSVNELKTLVLLQAIGGIAADRTLLFLAAGLSWSDTSGTITNLDGIPFFDAFSVGRQAVGTAVGGGVEYAFSERVSARVKVDVISSNAFSTVDNAGNLYQISNTIVEGTVGVSYKFG